LLAAAVARNLRQLGLSQELIAGLILCALLFPPLFNISTQVLRQSMATALFVYGLSTVCSGHRRKAALLCLASVGIHTSMIIPCFLCFIGSVLIQLGRWRFLFVTSMGVFFFVTSLRFIFSGFLSSLGLDGAYVLLRLSQQEFFDLGGVKLETYGIALLFLMSFFSAPGLPLRLEILLRGFTVLAIFVLLFGRDPMLSEVVIRASMLLYFLIWLPVLIFVLRIAQRSEALFFVCMLIVPWFFYNIFSSKWTFAHDVYVASFGSIAHLLAHLH
jgi:hypothetical protein